MIKFVWKLFKTAIKALILLALIGGGIFAYARLIEPYMLETTTASISGPEITSDEELKIVLFGDTHLGFDYDLEDFHKVVSEINAQNPDIIVFSGDLIDDLNTYDGDTAKVSEALSMLEAEAGKYAVHGNHDYELSGNDPYTEIMEAGGFDVLKNETVYLPDLNIKIYGIEDCLIGNGDPTIISDASTENFNLIICHEPDIFDRMTEYDVSLMLSGHSHGGQVRIPFYTQKFLPAYGTKYINGLYEVGDNTLYVTKGIGTTKLPLRFMAKPEIVAITID